ncbi:serine/threonine-protein kinase HipA [Acinetobacter baumannii NIPH 410]|nr:serine/threonine-protein kinase HipA [Acinetobacter baumannii NIPH 410]
MLNSLNVYYNGWGMLLMDRYFRKIGLHPARISPLERLTYISTHAMGALSFEPCVAEMQTSENIPLPQLAQEVQEVLKGEGGEFFTTFAGHGWLPPRCQIQSIGLPKSCQF